MREIGAGYKIVIQASQILDTPPVIVESFIPEEISLGYTADFDQPFQAVNGIMQHLPSMIGGAKLGEATGSKLGKYVGGALGVLASSTLSQAAGTGRTPTAPIFTAKMWQSTSTPEITIPLFFEAESNPLLEIRKPIVDLLSLVIPSVNSIGILKSPASYLDFTKVLSKLSDEIKSGANSAASEAKGLMAALEATMRSDNILSQGITAGKAAYAESQKSWDNALSEIKSNNAASKLSSASSAQLCKKPTTESSSISSTIQDFLSSKTMMKYLNKVISIRIGTYLAFPCVVIQNVTPTFTSQIDYMTGWPMAARVDLTFSPMFTTVQADINDMFNGIPQQMSAALSQGYAYNSLTGLLGSKAAGALGGAADSLIQQGGSFISGLTSSAMEATGVSQFGTMLTNTFNGDDVYKGLTDRK